jgi:hypothetical protein
MLQQVLCSWVNYCQLDKKLLGCCFWRTTGNHDMLWFVSTKATFQKRRTELLPLLHTNQRIVAGCPRWKLPTKALSTHGSRRQISKHFKMVQQCHESFASWCSMCIVDWWLERLMCHTVHCWFIR